MTAGSNRDTGSRTADVERLARQDHERGCRGEPPFVQISVSHRLVHEAAAIRALNRRTVR